MKRFSCGISYIALHLLWDRGTNTNYIGVSVGAAGDKDATRLMGGIGLLLFDDLFEVFQGEFMGIVFWQRHGKGIAQAAVLAVGAAQQQMKRPQGHIGRNSQLRGVGVGPLQGHRGQQVDRGDGGFTAEKNRLLGGDKTLMLSRGRIHHAESLQ